MLHGPLTAVWHAVAQTAGDSGMQDVDAAYAADGDPDNAAASALSALEIARATDSARTHQEMVRCSASIAVTEDARVDLNCS